MKFGDNHTRYAVESGVPTPSVVRKTRKSTLIIRSTLLYPLHCMKIGDSFFVEGQDRETYASVNNSTQSWISRYPRYRFALRKVTERGKAGIRVWRVTPRIGHQLA